MLDHRTALRVIVLDHTAELGGAELALTRLAAHLKNDVDLRIMLFASGPLRELMARAGIGVVVLSSGTDLMAVDRHTVGRPSLATLRRGISAISFVFTLARRLRRSGVDVVMANSLKSGLIGVLAARLAGKPLVWFIHDRIAPDYLSPLLVRVVRYAARRASRVVANSAATRATLPGVQTTIVYPGFAPEQALVDPALRVEPRVRTVGIIGRISPTKGQVEFVRAAAIVRERVPGIQFRIVGAPLFSANTYLAEVQAEVDELELGNCMTFTGFISDPVSEIDQLSVLVHASPIPEPFGQVIVEGMIRMVPVIATDAGGAPEIVGGDQSRGLLVPPGDHAALAQAIVQTLTFPKDAKVRTSAAYEWAMNNVTAERSAGRLAAVLQEAAEVGRQR